jgi:Capsule polysaccharide biosynthesis protein
MRSALRSALRQAPLFASARLWRLNYVARHGAHQDLRGLVQPDSERWRIALAASKTGPRVLIATNSGGHFGLAAIDRLLAIALTLRGASTTTVLCDGVLSACLMCEHNIQPDVARFAKHGPAKLLCSFCYPPAADATSKLALPLERIGSFLQPDDIAEAQRFAQSVPFAGIGSTLWQGAPVGEHALAGALRYFAKGTMADEPLGEAVARRFLVATVSTAIAYGRLLESMKPSVVVAHHGIYAPQGIVAALARRRGIRVVTWNPAYRRQCFIFSHDETYHHSLMTEPTERWTEKPLTPAQRELIVDYLRSRQESRDDWISFHKPPDYEVAKGLRELGLDPDKPLIAAYTNVFWDAQLHYPQNAFSSQLEWLEQTIRFFETRPDLQLAIRIHPAEVSGVPVSRQRARDEIAKSFARLPANVVVIDPESALSSYRLADLADAVLIYGTKMGVELAARGMPVIVAGEAWVRNKGFTVDIRSPDHYREVLGGLPFRQRMVPVLQERALVYAHHFFFRRMIPLGMIESEANSRRFRIAADTLDALAAGGDRGLDIVCQGILEARPFET